MNLSKSPLRRAAGLAAGAVLGLAGVAVAASPAYATDSDIKYTVRCDTATGDWVVDWTVTGNAPSGVNKFRFNRVDSTVGDGKPGGEQPVKEAPYKVSRQFVHEVNTPIAASQRVDGDLKYTRLTVVTEFDNRHRDMPRSNTAYFDGTCSEDEQPPQPEPSKSSASPEPSASESESASPSPSASSPSTSESQSPSPTPSSSETPELPDDLPGNPVPIYEVTCDTMTVGFDNPEDSIPIKLHFKTSKGEERDLTIAPGTKDSETFSAKDGFSVDVTVTVTYKGETYSEDFTLDYVNPGDDCDNGEGGGLPVTGAAAGGVAAGAAGLLAIGGLLFFMARRRKVKFTA
ncbi:LPXTG cell wall anchor domain-containing protein [Actinoplanes couchii]|uniref:LPXTG-motif cell wall anchor domain protein n=1 Tax=Actinoplanes couchii TaxID=403638 RepID=A0ABQ3X5H3_9ACTN|nr:LPXTG cell wall anchor domain-containing protein [Actinoplanes couchii]MDR6325534.1 LPXTG-motif cell wall-anchored protein [Actinoplanes couchii]GID53766.1 hypothetical protein Aco03nite_021700 [Actinoplanes couchii]